MTKKDRLLRRQRAADIAAALSGSAFATESAVQAALAKTERGSLTSPEAIHALNLELDADQEQALFELVAAIDQGAKSEQPSATSASETATRAPPTVSRGRLCTLFSKELRKAKKNTLALPPAVLACTHDFFGDELGGPVCQICAFPTQKRVWKCRLDCGVLLCGSCAFKYGKKA